MLARLALVVALSGATCSSPTAPADGGPEDVRIDHRHAPDALPACPASPPAVRSACAAPSELCSYGDPCSFQRFACESGRWVLTVADGGLVLTCPSEAPMTGSTCPSCGSSITCRYPTSCDGGEATVTSICSGGHWLTGTGPCAAEEGG